MEINFSNISKRFCFFIFTFWIAFLPWGCKKDTRYREFRQTRISGFVIDEDTKIPLAGLTWEVHERILGGVSLYDTDTILRFRGLTDEYGRFDSKMFLRHDVHPLSKKFSHFLRIYKDPWYDFKIAIDEGVWNKGVIIPIMPKGVLKVHIKNVASVLPEDKCYFTGFGGDRYGFSSFYFTLLGVDVDTSISILTHLNQDRTVYSRQAYYLGYTPQTSDSGYIYLQPKDTTFYEFLY